MTFRSYVEEVCEMWMNFMLQLYFIPNISHYVHANISKWKKYKLQSISGCKHFGWGVNLYLGLLFKELPVATPENISLISQAKQGMRGKMSSRW